MLKKQSLRSRQTVLIVLFLFSSHVHILILRHTFLTGSWSVSVHKLVSEKESAWVAEIIVNFAFSNTEMFTCLTLEIYYLN